MNMHSNSLTIVKTERELRYGCHDPRMRR